ncbi:hypothetical protein F5Y17DRAFT_357633 [Xylariaceae sp. FL0594]|nr:hypothetical protein F5Y17DRAFT_357633 [Xylariaceae sp. FL0594]
MSGYGDGGSHASPTRSPLGKPVVGRPRRSRSRSRGPVGSQENEAPSADPAYSRSRAGSVADCIPRVPRIPAKFQSDCSNTDSARHDDLASEYGRAVASEVVSEHLPRGGNGERVAVVNLDSIPAPHSRYLPGCSVGQPKEVQIISNSMIKAYVAMRGNWLGDENGKDDPLFTWIQQRGESKKGSKTANSERDIGRMLEMIDWALDSAHAGGDTPGDCIFELERPDYGHIKPPQDMDLSAHDFVDACGDFDREEDSDDEEAGARDGRISPCTFLQWSKGCVRWNADIEEVKAPLEVTSSFKRMRPPTPEPGTMPEPRRRPCAFDIRWEPQCDVETGDELTPAYTVPSSPSIIFTPPGVEVRVPMPPDLCDQYSRMAPLAARAYYNHLYGGKSTLPSLTSSDGGMLQSITASEVNGAVSKYMPEIGCNGPSEVRALLQKQWQATLRAEVQADELYQLTQRQSEEISQLQYDLHQMDRFTPALHLWREAKEERERKMREERAKEEQRKEKRVRAIRARVADHVLEVQARHDRSWDKWYLLRGQAEKNAERIAELRSKVQDICASVGVRDPGHALSVLMDVAEGREARDDEDEGAGDVEAEVGNRSVGGDANGDIDHDGAGANVSVSSAGASVGGHLGGYPAGDYPVGGYPAGGYPAGGYPAGGYPAGGVTAAGPVNFDFATDFDRTYHATAPGNNFYQGLNYHFGPAQASLQAQIQYPAPSPAQGPFSCIPQPPPTFGGSYIPVPPPPHVLPERENRGGVIHDVNPGYGRNGHITTQPVVASPAFFLNGEAEFEAWMNAWQAELAAKNQHHQQLLLRDQAQHDNNDKRSHDGGDSGVSGVSTVVPHEPHRPRVQSLHQPPHGHRPGHGYVVGPHHHQQYTGYGPPGQAAAHYPAYGHGCNGYGHGGPQQYHNPYYAA